MSEEIARSPWDRGAMIDALQEATPSDRISFLPRSVRKDGDSSEKGTAVALPYVDARFIRERLDQAVGPLNWQSRVENVGGFLMVGIAIRDSHTGEWIWRWDTAQDEPTSEDKADDTDEDEISGGKTLVSGGFKRCGYQFGIASDLYAIPKRRVPCVIRVDQRGNARFVRWAVDDVLIHLGGVPHQAKHSARPSQQQERKMAAPPFDPKARDRFYQVAGDIARLPRNEVSTILKEHSQPGQPPDYSAAAADLERKYVPKGEWQFATEVTVIAK